MSSKQMVALPAYTFRVRLAQAIIAVLILVLDIISTIILGGYGALGYGIFTPFATIVITSYWYNASYKRPQYYNRWSILVLDCFAVIWWLAMWTVLAEWSAALGLISDIDNEVFGGADLTQINAVHALTAVAAVLGAAEFVLFVVSLVSFSVALHRTRRSERQNAHANPFTNPDYQASNGSVSMPSAVRPKGGFEVV